MSDLVVGQQYGEWTIVSITGKRAGCRCRCGAVHALAVDAVTSGSAVTSCGCTYSREQGAALREEYLKRQRQREWSNI
jgi:hypothetical protein